MNTFSKTLPTLGLLFLPFLPLLAGSTTDIAATPSVVEGANNQVNEINVGKHPEILTDPTKVFQEAFDSSAHRVFIPNLGEPYVVEPLFIKRGNKEIVIEAGVVIRAKKGAFKSTTSCLLRLENVRNVTIQGNGATLEMNRMEYRDESHEPSEHRHGLSIGGCENIIIENLSVNHTGGDGIYIAGAYYFNPPYPDEAVEVKLKGKNGPTTRREIITSRNIIIRKVVADHNHRQGLSLISGDKILIEDCVFKNTSGTAPSDGLDIEPSMPHNIIRNVVVRNCVAENNDGVGFMVYLRKMKKSSEPVDILFENCRVLSGKGTGLAVGAIGDEGVESTIIFNNCFVENTQKPGLYVYDKSYKTGKVIFENCIVQNAAISAEQGTDSPELAASQTSMRRPPQAPIVFFLRRLPDLTDQFGGVELRNCYVEDSLNRPVIAQGARSGPEDIIIRNVSGSVKTKHQDPVMHLGEYVKDVNIELSAK